MQHGVHIAHHTPHIAHCITLPSISIQLNPPPLPHHPPTPPRSLDPSPDDMEEFLAMGISCGLTEEFVAAAVRRAGLDGGDGEGD